MTQDTHTRYKRALEAIADGADNPQAVATEALRSRKQEPAYKRKHEAEVRREAASKRRAERLARAQKMYLEWIKAGYPPIAAFGRKFEMTRSSMDRLLEVADRELPHDEQRLAWSYRTNDFITRKESISRTHVKWMVWDTCDCHHGNLSSGEWQTANTVIEKAVSSTYRADESDEWCMNAAIKYLQKNFPVIWSTMICRKELASS